MVLKLLQRKKIKTLIFINQISMEQATEKKSCQKTQQTISVIEKKKDNMKLREMVERWTLYKLNKKKVQNKKSSGVGEDEQRNSPRITIYSIY